MIGEVSLYGIYMPWALVLAIVTLGVSWFLRRLLALTGIYRLVWHPALFDLALYVVLFYGVVWISPYVFSRLS
jgi:protein AaeX